MGGGTLTFGSGGGPAMLKLGGGRLTSRGIIGGGGILTLIPGGGSTRCDIREGIRTTED